MTTPTLEQREEMARWVGLCFHSWALKSDTTAAPYWICDECQAEHFMENYTCAELPRYGENNPDFTDLTTMFNLVVPQIREGSSNCDIFFGYPENGLVTCEIEVCRYKGEDRGKSSSAEDESPGLALFWAVWKLVKEDKGNG